MKTNFTIGTLQQIDEIAYLEQQCFHKEAWNISQIENTIQSKFQKVLLLKSENLTIGYCIIQLIDGEAELERIGILPIYQKHGYAKWLLNQSLKYYQIERCFLEVKDSNSSAISLYQKCGFKMIAKRLNYYSDGSDALIMEWKMII